MRYLENVGLPSDKPVSRVGLGTWQFGSGEWGYGAEYDATEAGRIVARAAELGITLFDTAEAYGFGRSERILGRALEEHGLRDSAVVATKLFPLLPVAPVVRRRAAASAARLGVDRIDLYQVHQPNPVVRDGFTMPGMRDLQDAGVIGAVGVSNYSLDRWQQAERDLGRPVLSNQVQLSLAHLGPLDDLVPYAAARGRMVIAWSPLAQGFLSCRYDATHRPSSAVRAMNPLFLEESLVRAAGLLDALRDVAGTHGVTPAQVALAWLIHHPAVVAIPGASSVAQVEANAAAADISLTDDEVAELTAQARAFEHLGVVAAVRGVAGRLLRR
ncbi:MAG: aldo/keto reductase [Actinomycetia bacterium]|jgi:aryl-alcohol dehydrogenase-like predicted oxidoreductase|nr:aldo/keto reductase [Actinomycetes bacterium]